MARKKTETMRQYITDYVPLAVISELCFLTPENISLSSMDAGLIEEDNNNAEGKKGKGNAASESKRHMRVQGVVSAEFTALEGTLTGYVISLGDSPLFGGDYP